ncbi:hypothetical protein [Caulobacter sp.]|uniref:hypothetical protein n=1 Tax=Caulobacter sp. TaxID=78 RepID=UPI0031E3561F
MPYALISGETATELYGLPFEAGEVQYPGNIINLWTPEQLADIGVLSIVLAEPPPAGQVVTGRTLEVRSGVPHEVTTFGPAPPPPVPDKVSRMQAKQALLHFGLLDQFDDAIATSGDRSLQLYWAETSEFHRNHSKVSQLGESQGLTSAQLDDLFRFAATVV